MSSIVSVKMQGGLGNIMFQAAFAASLSYRKKCEYELADYQNNIDFNVNRMNRLNSNLYKEHVFYKFNFNILENKEVINYPETPFHFVDVPFAENTKNVYVGYFQSEKYFYDCHEYIRELYQPHPAIIQKINSLGFDFNNSVSIHVRRGDFVNQPQNHPSIGVSYLNSAISYFGIHKNYLVVSDDLEWCKVHLGHLPNVFFLEGKLEFVDMFAMSLCENNIIANSTFSWWGAWLNKNEDKKVIAPKYWFGLNYAWLKTGDIYPNGWIIL